MSDYKKLDPAIRAQALVGLFLQGWSAMEIGLHDAIGAALNIETTRLWILCANLRFQDKTNILRTLVDVSAFSDDEKTQAKKRLRKLGSRSGRRNMIAHEPFTADPDGDGVRFVTVKAKGEFETPEIAWSIHKFVEEDRISEGYTKFFRCLEERFKAKPLTQRNYLDALKPFLDFNMGMEAYPWMTPPNNQRSMSPALLDHLSRQAPAQPDSGQATGEKTAQTPGSSEKTK